MCVCVCVCVCVQVKDKMVYAATKATLRKAFTSDVIVDYVAATTKVRSTALFYGLLAKDNIAQESIRAILFLLRYPFRRYPFFPKSDSDQKPWTIIARLIFGLHNRFEISI